MDDNYLEINDLSKHFPGFSLNHINFSLPKGYIMGLVGPNGSGKSTTIQLILNLLERSSGRITVLGKDNITEEASVKQDLGVVFDHIFYTQGFGFCLLVGTEALPKLLMFWDLHQSVFLIGIILVSSILLYASYRIAIIAYRKRCWI